ncbi:MAG: tetratricopeptide repeat protein [Planctomycetota bacterium]|jgi:tetratricopeptide (TPR) repeat protein
MLHKLPLCLALLTAASPALAQNDETSPPQDAAADAPRGLQIQRLDDPALPIKPVKPRSAEEEARVNARAWYMTGRVYQQKQDYRAARDAFEKARNLDPQAVYVYRDLIEVYFHLRKPDEAVKLAMEAVKLDPDDFELLRTIGFEMVKQRRLADAIRYLEQARNSPKIDPQSGFYVIVNKDLGIIYSGLGEMDKAADCYEVVLQALLKPSTFGLDSRTVSEFEKAQSTSYERIGQVLIAASRTEPAKQALERALARRRGKPSAVNLLLAELFHQTEEPQKALEQILIFFEANVQRGRAPYVLFRDILTKLDDTGSLLPRLEALADSDPENRDLKLFLAETYVDNDRLEPAEAIYLESLKERPTNGAYLGLARIYRQQKKAQELVDNLSVPYVQSLVQLSPPPEIEAELEAIAEASDFAADLVDLGTEAMKATPPELAFGASLLLASVSASVERYDESEQFFRHALKANPAQASLIVREFGQTMLSAERYEVAAQAYQEATGNPLLQGEKAQNFLMLATARELNGETDAALEAIAAAADIRPNNEFIEYREAWIYYHAHRYETAAEKYAAHIEKHKQSRFLKQAKFSLSAIYVELGQMAKGEQILEEYLAENPDDPGVNNDLGYLYADQGKNLEKARSMIEKAVEAEPKNPAYLDSMGWVLFKLKEFEAARDWLEKATKLEDGDDSTIWDHLGDCHQQLDATGDARDAWTKALKLARDEKPQDPDLIEKIEAKLKALKPADTESGDEKADAE